MKQTALLAFFIGLLSCSTSVHARWEYVPPGSSGMDAYGSSYSSGGGDTMCAGSGMFSQTVADAQKLLRMKGFNPGVADGVFGSRTAQAVRSYQARYGLYGDGCITPVLMSHLRTATY